MSDRGRLLLVDDDETFRTRLMRAFEDRGFEVRGASNHGEALQIASEFSPEKAVVDLRMPGKSGLDVVSDLVARLPEIKIVVLTGYGSIATALETVRLGAVDYLTKPADADQILAALQGPGRGAKKPEPPESAPSLERVEWEHIQRVLADCDGNVSQAARVLGIHRRTLQRKLANFPPRR